MARARNNTCVSYTNAMACLILVSCVVAVADSVEEEAGGGQGACEGSAQDDSEHA